MRPCLSQLVLIRYLRNTVQFCIRLSDLNPAGGWGRHVTVCWTLHGLIPWDFVFR